MSGVQFCNWCVDPESPDPAWHPEGRAEHRHYGEQRALDELRAKVRAVADEYRRHPRWLRSQEVGKMMGEWLS